MLVESVLAQDIADELRRQRPVIPDTTTSPGIPAWHQWVADVRGIAAVIYETDADKRAFYKAANLPWPSNSRT